MSVGFAGSLDVRFRRGSRLPQWGQRALLYFVGGPTSGRSFSGTEPAPFAAGRGSNKGGGVHCFVCGRPDLGAKLFRHRAGPFAAGRGSYNGRRALLCFLWEARPRGEVFQTPSRRRSPRGAPPTIGAACTALFFVRGPTSGLSFSGTEPAHSPRVAAPTIGGGVHCFVFCGRPDLGAKLFQTPSRPIRRVSRLPQWRRVARFLWEGRLFGPQPMVIRLALPPAAAVLMLSARSISKRSSGISVSPGAMPCMPTMGPLRRARCWLTSRNWSGLP